MKTVKFIKAHPAGIQPDSIHTVADQSADRWIEQGYAEEHTVEAPEEVPPADSLIPEPPAEETKDETPEVIEPVVEEVVPATQTPAEDVLTVASKQDSKTSQKKKGENQ